MACTLTRINPEKNEYRFYNLHIAPTLFGDWSLVREWGRIGRGGTLKLDTYPTENEACEKLEALKVQKLKRGYS